MWTHLKTLVYTIAGNATVDHLSTYLAMRIALEKKAKAISDGNDDSSSLDAEAELGTGEDGKVVSFLHQCGLDVSDSVN